MRKFIAVFLILIGLTVSVLSIREYSGKNKHIDLLGYELSLKNKKARNVFYRNTGIGLLILAGGVVVLTGSRKK